MKGNNSWEVSAFSSPPEKKMKESRVGGNCRTSKSAKARSPCRDDHHGRSDLGDFRNRSWAALFDVILDSKRQGVAAIEISTERGRSSGLLDTGRYRGTAIRAAHGIGELDPYLAITDGGPEGAEPPAIPCPQGEVALTVDHLTRHAISRTWVWSCGAARSGIAGSTGAGQRAAEALSGSSPSSR